MKILDHFSKEELEEIASKDERSLFLCKEERTVSAKVKDLARIALGYDKPKPSENTIIKTADFYADNEFVLRLLGSMIENPARKLVIERPPRNTENSKIIWPNRPYAILLSSSAINSELLEEGAEEEFLFVVD